MSDITAATLNGLFKEVYADQINNLLPDSAKILKTIGFAKTEKTGNQFHQPVILTRSAGFTYGGNAATAYSLNAGIPMNMQDATIKGYEFTLRDVVALGVLSRSANGDKSAFVDAMSLVVEQMMDSMVYRIELSALYGGSGIGIAASSANQDTTHTVITVTTASWTAGIWSGAENAQFQFYTANTTLVSSAADSIFTVTSVDVANLKLTVSGTTTGIAALDTAIAGNANNVYIYFNGQFGNEASGIDQIVQSGLTGGPATLYGITAANYNLWKGNTFSSSSAALTLGKVLSAIGAIVGRGLKSEVEVHLNPTTWQNINSDQAALRRYGSEDDAKYENAAEELMFYGPNGLITLVPNIYVKQGEGFILVDPSRQEYWKRIGSTDITFNIPGTSDQFFLPAPDKNGYEMRVYTDQSIFSPLPSKSGKITLIVNN